MLRSGEFGRAVKEVISKGMRLTKGKQWSQIFFSFCYKLM